MSRWSVSEAASMEDDRGLVEPTAALVATIAVCLGVSLYAGVLDDAIPPVERDVATPTLQRVHSTLVTGGVVYPDRLLDSDARVPPGYSLNASITTETEHWSIGPRPPQHADRARRHVSVVLTPGVIRREVLEVAVWT